MLSSSEVDILGLHCVGVCVFEVVVISLSCAALLYLSLHRSHSFRLTESQITCFSTHSCFCTNFSMSDSDSDSLTVRRYFRAIGFLCFLICCNLYIIVGFIGIVILGVYVLTGPLVFIVIPLLIFWGCSSTCPIFCIYISKKCTSCCSDDVPSQETSPVESPPPVQRNEQTAVTIEFEEKGGPTSKLGTPSTAQSTTPPETQSDLKTTAVPPSYQVYIQPRWLAIGSHCKVISNPVYKLLVHADMKRSTKYMYTYFLCRMHQATKQPQRMLSNLFLFRVTHLVLIS